jgi:hypothetical protein
MNIRKHILGESSSESTQWYFPAPKLRRGPFLETRKPYDKFRDNNAYF